MPKKVRIAWIAMRAGLLVWGIYGLFHGSVVEFLQAIFAIAFTHLWDMFQLWGGRSFITKVHYKYQTLLNAFIFFGTVIGSTINNRTSFEHCDLISHFLAGALTAYFAYDFAFLIQGKKGRLSPALASMFSLGFSCAICVGWEFYEFTMDRLYGLHLQRSLPTSDCGLTDTMVDLIIGVAGALIAMLYIAFKRNGVIGKDKNRIKQQKQRENEQAAEKERVWQDYLLKKRERENLFNNDSFFTETPDELTDK
ncbi:MAG: hypothetical protein K5755_04145 [Clostridiales bacterium]|nr:hypothetical protein [Clostridia bacterium]MCR4563810.1 hypothetical protein [Clostridiales bacterium]